MRLPKLEMQKFPQYICALAEGTCQADAYWQAVQAVNDWETNISGVELVLW